MREGAVLTALVLLVLLAVVAGVLFVIGFTDWRRTR